MSARTLDPEGYELQEPISVEKGNEIFFIRVWKPLSNIYILKTLRETIFTISGLGLLQIVSELDTKCVRQ